MTGPTDTPTATEAAPAAKEGSREASGPSGPRPPGDVKTRAGLWWLGALARAFVNWPIDFYPRLSRGKTLFRKRAKSLSLNSDAILQEIVPVTAAWDKLCRDGTCPADLEKAIELAKASLDEVKQQTEYQDQKATRLLTVTTFLSALSGALFASFSANYPLRHVQTIEGGWKMALIAAYVSFLLFVLAALSGALVTFHATRTRFKYPDQATAAKEAGPTRSYLFFREMIRVSPAGWANSFVTRDEENKVSLTELRVAYFRNYVVEAYLVAAKTADKLRYLQPGQSLLAWALRFLLLFACLIAAIQLYVAPAATAPTRVEIVARNAPAP